jgi:hypothetical protein
METARRQHTGWSGTENIQNETMSIAASDVLFILRYYPAIIAITWQCPIR